MVSQIVEIEKKLASISFPKHGCIYYKVDLEDRGLTPGNLTADVLDTHSLRKEFDLAILQKFSLGPLTEARHWDGERAHMALDRGPCKLRTTCYDNILILAQGALLWITSELLESMR